MLFNDLRIDKNEFNNLDVVKIKKLSNLYHSSNINLLVKCLERKNKK